MQERDKAITEAVVNDNWKPARDYCAKYAVMIPTEERIFKAGIYKAAHECTSLSDEVKKLAAEKCVALGFKPTIGG